MKKLILTILLLTVRILTSVNIRRTAGNHGNGYLVSLVRRELLSLRPTKPDCGQIQGIFFKHPKNWKDRV